MKDNRLNQISLGAEEVGQSMITTNDSSWRRCIRFCFDGRPYKRNNTEYPTVGMFIVTTLILLLPAAGLTYILPFKLFTVGMFFFFTTGYLFLTVTYANESAYGGYLLILFGALGIYFDVHWGLSILGYHLEPYWFALNIFIGVLAQFRRYWNSLIWTLLDKASEET